MAQVTTKPSTAPPPRKAIKVEAAKALRVTAYDRAASMIISLLMLVGAAALCMVVAWLSSGILRKEYPVPVVMEDLGGGGYENGIGTEGQMIEAPTESDIAAESDILDTEVPEAFSAVTDTTAETTASIEQFDMQFAPIERPTGGRSTGTGKHPAKGRGGGFGGGDRREPEWEIRFPPGNTVETYGKQLDFFGIELGIFDGALDVIYINKLQQEKPAKRVGARDAEKRKYMTWSRGDLDQADLELFKRAGVEVNGRTIFKFLPPETESRLTELQKAYKNRLPKDIRRTRFGIKPEGTGWAFYVLDQTFY